MALVLRSNPVSRSTGALFISNPTRKKRKNPTKRRKNRATTKRRKNVKRR